MKNKYQKTIIACFIGYIVQAIVNTFAPLLFLTFQSSYNIPLSQITILITVNFCTQLVVDLLCAGFVDKIGYRKSMVLAHIFSASGFILLTILPEILPSAFAGLLISVVLYAIGGGILEVLVSPIVESCPSDNKEATMSILHSFYSWGYVGVVLLSTLFFQIFGIENWKYVALLWALIPIFNAILFSKVPIAPLIKDGEKGLSMKELLHNFTFWVLLIMMICAGASEQGFSQWASTLAEKYIGVSKTIGDLTGPMLFAVLMGISRVFYGKYGDKIKLENFMIGSAILCILSYIGISLIPSPYISLLSCGLCGLSVGIMWPGTFSKAAATIKNGGTAMFSLLALGGDLGCSCGPSLVGFVSGFLQDNLKLGIFSAIIFPIVLLAGILLCNKLKASEK